QLQGAARAAHADARLQAVAERRQDWPGPDQLLELSQSHDRLGLAHARCQRFEDILLPCLVAVAGRTKQRCRGLELRLGGQTTILEQQPQRWINKIRERGGGMRSQDQRELATSGVESSRQRDDKAGAVRRGADRSGGGGQGRLAPSWLETG